MLNGHMAMVYQQVSLVHFLALLVCDAHVPNPWSSTGDVHMLRYQYNPDSCRDIFFVCASGNNVFSIVLFCFYFASISVLFLMFLMLFWLD